MKSFLLDKKALKALSFKLLPSEREELKIYGNVVISVQEDCFLLPELEGRSIKK